jgi:hypothetical protein
MLLVVGAGVGFFEMQIFAIVIAQNVLLCWGAVKGLAF